MLNPGPGKLNPDSDCTLNPNPKSAPTQDRTLQMLEFIR